MRLRIYIVMVFLAGMFPASINAQSVGVEVQPELSIVYAKPGSTITIPVVIKNTGNQGSFMVKGVGLKPQGVHGDLVPTHELPQGIRMEPRVTEPFFLPTGAERKLEMNVVIDPLVSTQDYYVATQITSVGKKRAEGKSSVAIDLTVLSTVLLTVTNDGNMDISGYISSFNTGKSSGVRIYDSTHEIPLNLVIHNSGDNWMNVSGTITASGMFGDKKLIKIPTQRVLANTKRLMRSTQTSTPEHTTLLSGMHIGKYTITARMAIEGRNTIATKTITFIGFPFRLVGALSLLGLLAIIIGARANHRPHPRQVHPHQL